MQAALAEAHQSFYEGGIPIGSVIVVDGHIIGRGHNRRCSRATPYCMARWTPFRAPDGSAPVPYRPCHALQHGLALLHVRGGTSLLYKIPRIVIGENRTVADTTLCEDWLLRARGVAVVVLDLPEYYQLMQKFIQLYPEV